MKMELNSSSGQGTIVYLVDKDTNDNVVLHMALDTFSLFIQFKCMLAAFGIVDMEDNSIEI